MSWLYFPMKCSVVNIVMYVKMIQWQKRMLIYMGLCLIQQPNTFSNFQYITLNNLSICLMCSFQPTIGFIIFWDFSMFYQIFLSPQVKRCAIITYKHARYKLPHELPNDLKNIRNLSKLHRMIAQCPVPLPKWKFSWY